ncbi:MAG: cation diffusion facilitator family transporter [Syntrophobacteraceae bacterium]|jgi:cation diffusion facilitator family transporter
MDEGPNAATENKQRLSMMALSVSVSALLMVLKFYAYRLTGSYAILSDALESIINVVASGFALWSVLLASKPPDVRHPYGHGTIEFFSVGFEGALIVLTAGGILWEALPRIIEPRALPELDVGLLILLGTALLNLLLGKALIRTGERTRSMAISADGKHILTDVYTTAGVLIGLLLVRQTGWYFLDGAVACAVAANILFIGARLVHQSSLRLMHAYDPELLDQISAIIAQHRKPEWIDVHRLRAWRSGRQIYIDFHLILPRSLSLEDAHSEVTEMEKLLKTQLPGVGEAMIHVEPCIGPECRICLQEPCGIRSHAFFQQPSWCRKEVIYPGAAESESDSDPDKSESGRKFTRAGSD